MNRDQQNERGDRDLTANNLEQQSSVPNDLPDSPHDRERLEQREETIIDLPDVEDIPGQEFVHAPRLGGLADTTASSDDEEGVRVFGRGDTRNLTDMDTDVSDDERRALEDTEYMPTQDEDNLRRAHMDNVDFQGEELNERSFGAELSGADIDTQGNDDTETNTTAMGQGDEENKLYSLGSDDNDNVTEGTP